MALPHISAIETGDDNAELEADRAKWLLCGQQASQAAPLGEAQEAIEGPIALEDVLQVCQGFLQSDILHGGRVISGIPPAAILRGLLQTLGLG